LSIELDYTLCASLPLFSFRIYHTKQCLDYLLCWNCISYLTMLLCFFVCYFNFEGCWQLNTLWVLCLSWRTSGKAFWIAFSDFW